MCGVTWPTSWTSSSTDLTCVWAPFTPLLQLFDHLPPQPPCPPAQQRFWSHTGAPSSSSRLVPPQRTTELHRNPSLPSTAAARWFQPPFRPKDVTLFVTSSSSSLSLWIAISQWITVTAVYNSLIYATLWVLCAITEALWKIPYTYHGHITEHLNPTIHIFCALDKLCMYIAIGHSHTSLIFDIIHQWFLINLLLTSTSIM